MDDILIFGSNRKDVCETKRFLSTHFEMKGLGLANMILGLKITRALESIVLS